jgi:septum site-determining protein MinC
LPAESSSRFIDIFMSEVANKKAELEFKSASLTVPALLLASNDLVCIDNILRKKINQAPEFFKDSPLLIDLHRLNAQQLTIDFDALVNLLRQLSFLPIGLRGGSVEQNKAALAIGIALHAVAGRNSNQGSEADSTAPAETDSPAGASAPADRTGAAKTTNKIITQPVRSGQRVYAHGDLTITATVSAGAEIMAEGNIHVYGSLRGRALAGVLGDTSSRIFCKDLQAELLSIAGVYQLRDDIPKAVQHKAVQVSLDKQMIVIAEI